MENKIEYIIEPVMKYRVIRIEETEDRPRGRDDLGIYSTMEMAEEIIRDFKAEDEVSKETAA